jgi:hypothetical protein
VTYVYHFAADRRPVCRHLSPQPLPSSTSRRRPAMCSSASTAPDTLRFHRTAEALTIESAPLFGEKTGAQAMCISPSSQICRC